MTTGTEAITRGACRTLSDMGFSVLTEFRLGSGRRADVTGLNAKGMMVIVEVKSSLADYRADAKWPEYLPYCDSFYFAVADGFPRQILSRPEAMPEVCGLIVADRFGGAVLRHAAERKMNAARRRAELLRFARKAAARWQRAADPSI